MKRLLYKNQPTHAFRGSILRPPVHGKDFEMIDDGLVVVEDGKIIAAADLKAIESETKQRLARVGVFVSEGEVRFREMLLNGNQQVILPTTADTHVHAFQPPGVPGALLEFDEDPNVPPTGWLPRTLAFENQIKKNPDRAWEIASQRMKQAIDNGIASLLYYTTSSRRAAEIVLSVAKDLGVHALVGYVCMDQNIHEPGLGTSADEAIRETKKLLDSEWRQNVVVIDRFPIAVSSPTRQQLVTLCQQYNVGIETHMDESVDEIAHHKGFYEGRSISQVLLEDRFFDTRQAGIAHGIHTTAEEMEAIALKIEGGCTVYVRACPGSNYQLRSHDVKEPETGETTSVHFPLREWQEAGAIITLGTDQGGGRNTSILREALDQRGRSVRKGDRPSNLELLRMATIDGARSTGRDIRQMNLRAGTPANFMVVDMAGAGGADYDDAEHFGRAEFTASRIIEGGKDPQKIRAVYNDGRLLKFKLRF